MSEVQSRLTPPPQPRELQSRVSAQSSREIQNTPTIPFSTVIDTTIQELQRSKRVMPQEDKLPHRFGIGLHVVGLASENSIREDAFKKSFPGLRLRRLRPQELHATDSFLDAQSKAITAAQDEAKVRHTHPIQQLRKQSLLSGGLWRANPVIGLDSINVIPEDKGDGTIQFAPLGKPERVANGSEMATIQKRFQTLSEMALKNNWPAIPYIVEMATYIHNPKGKNNIYDAYSVKQMAILLDPQVISYIASPEGFAQYQSIAEQTYPSLAKTAGGMKIETFRAMGAITHITNDVDELKSMQFKAEGQDETFASALLLATGKLDVGLLHEYQEKFPPTLTERVRSTFRRTRPN